MTARLLSDKDLQLIRKFDKRPADTQDALLAEVWLLRMCMHWCCLCDLEASHLQDMGE